jgi:cysteinyl-tRNA synthetase
MDLKTGESKGCGLVQFETPEDAEKAINDLDGSMLSGNVLKIRKDIQTRKSFDSVNQFKSEENFKKEKTVSKKDTTKNSVRSLDSVETFLDSITTSNKVKESYISERWKARAESSKTKIGSSKSVSKDTNSSGEGEVTKKIPKEMFLAIPYKMDPKTDEYLQEIKDQKIRSEKIEIISGLVAKRESMRINKQFNDADIVRLELRDLYNVQCDDRQRLWRILT